MIKGNSVKRKSYHRICRALIIGTAAFFLAGLPAVAAAMEAQHSGIKGSAGNDLAELERRAADIWGPDNVWIPGPHVLVQYETDLGERSSVDFENGVVQVQILLKAGDNTEREIVRAHLRQGVGNLILGEANDPVAMIKAQESETRPAAQKDVPATALPAGREIRVYLVRRGDSLWKIARQFRMKTEELAELNGLAADKTLNPGRPLKVLVYSSHDLTLDSTPRSPSKVPLLLDQIRMVDGRPVPPWLVREFAAEVVGDKPLASKKVVGADGVERLAVSVSFKLVSNHLEVRARKFHPLVQDHAQKHALDPAVIMAVIHTESVFNPRARSRTPAYGLMQLSPSTGAREAYRMLYAKKQKLTAQYLYDPKNNIELGTAYFNILENKYMGKILDPKSRTYCAVGAYNAGAANVGRAFISKQSFTQATPVINRLKPAEVYARLVESLPFRESRNYVRKVFNRTRLYREWQ
jgi:membrane-bound lytic murein transglycosylase C